MTLKFYIVLITLFSAHLSFGLTEPSYTNSISSKKINLGDSIKQAIKRDHPSFKPLEFNFFTSNIKNFFKGERRLTPLGIVEDLNGDGKKDAVLLGKTNKKYQILAFLSSGNRYKTLVHEEWSSSEFKQFYIFKKRLTIYLSPALKENLVFKDGVSRGGFHIKSMGMFIQLYYLKGKSFQAFKLGNTDLQFKRLL